MLVLINAGSKVRPIPIGSVELVKSTFSALIESPEYYFRRIEGGPL